MAKQKTKDKVRMTGVLACMTTVTHEDKEVKIPLAHSFYASTCGCSDNCGSVNIVLEDINGKPFAAMQFEWSQVLGGLTDMAIEARNKAGVKLT